MAIPRKSDDDAPHIGHNPRGPEDLAGTRFERWLPTHRYHLPQRQVLRFPQAWIDWATAQPGNGDAEAALISLYSELAENPSLRQSPERTLDTAMARIKGSPAAHALEQALGERVEPEWVAPLAALHAALTERHGGLWVRLNDPAHLAGRLNALKVRLDDAGVRPKILPELVERHCGRDVRLPGDAGLASALARDAQWLSLPAFAVRIHESLCIEYGRRYQTKDADDELAQARQWAALQKHASAEALEAMLKTRLMRPEATWPPRPAELLAMTRTSRPWLPSGNDLLRWSMNAPSDLSDAEAKALAKARVDVGEAFLSNAGAADRQAAASLASAYWTALESPSERPAKPNNTAPSQTASPDEKPSVHVVQELSSILRVNKP